MVYLNLYIAHVQLILNCSGTCTVWPEFITGAFINSFCWSGSTKGLWGRETWVFAEKIMSRGLRACLRGQLYVSLCMSASSEAHCILSGQGCCLQVSAVGTWWGTPCSQNSCPVRPHMSCSCSEVIWKLAMFCSLSISSKKPPQSHWPQQYLSTSMKHSLELSHLMRPAGCFSQCSLFPQVSGQLKLLVMFLYVSASLSLPVYSGPLPDIYIQTLPKIIHVEEPHRGTFSAFPLTVLGISLSVFGQWPCTQGSRRTLSQVWPCREHKGNIDLTLLS